MGALASKARLLAQLPQEIVRTVPSLLVVLRSLLAALRRRIRRLRFGREQGRPLRVGVDIRPFYEHLTGIGWYLHYLIVELAGRDDIELNLYGDAMITEHGPLVHTIVPPNVPIWFFDMRGRPHSRFTRDLLSAAYPLLMAIENDDVFFGANYFLPRAMNAVARKRVVTVHDLTFRRFPELLQAETLSNLQREMTREIFRAERIICVSEATRRDLVETFSLEPSRAVTVHSGATPPLVPSPEAPLLPEKYLLFVSTVEPRKNLGVLLEAFESLKDRGEYDGELVIVGKVGWKSQHIVDRLMRSRHRKAIRHLHYVETGKLAHIYRRADIFVFPSIYEGFGFPMLEAMALGIPVVAANNSSLPEIGGDAALFFLYSDASELARAIRRIDTDPSLRSKLVERGRLQAARFTWKKAADETVAVLRSAAEE